MKANTIKETLRLFTEKSIVDASAALLERLGINYTTVLKDVPLDEYFKENDFLFQYVEKANEALDHIWHIGDIEDSSFPESSVKPDGNSAQYYTMSVFACEVKPTAVFSRSLAVALTRAFNRVSSKSVNFSDDLPVIVLMLQNGMLSIATCERSRRLDDRGERVGKVTLLRNIDCHRPHPGHRQILERIADEVKGCHTFEELHSKWAKSFSIDILSDNFFKEYKEIYEEIVEYATGKRMVKVGSKWEEHNNNTPCVEIMNEFSRFDNPEKSIRDYVKKLLGRLVFIQFLQKKGWMGVPAGDSWEGGDPAFLQNLFENTDKKESFIDDVLEPLFNDINTNRMENGDLITSPNVGVNKKVPYLNGGLFEEDEFDKTNFSLPSRFFAKLFDFFSRYNFTIDENAPDDVEIGVDPEMLGRIFENLLEDNKDKGAFYTPKFIVEYMCRESLISYLQTGVDNETTLQTYRDFVTSHDVDKLKSEDVLYVNKKLREVKICDPAIGSGAFPMGMLKELFECSLALSKKVEKRTPAEIKKDIIQNSIYGVDIEKGAVDIARLRFWLSLIIEEDTPHALPNMDFKIMQGNSLLEQYKGINLDDIYDGDRQLTLALGDDEEVLQTQFKDYLIEYFIEDDHSKKKVLLENIDNAVKALVKSKTFGNTEIVAAVDSLNLRNNQDFFLWHTWFSDVLKEKRDHKGKVIKGSGGFDIVIGNPPYVNVELMSPESKEIYKKTFKCFYKRSDMFALFMEQSLLNLTNRNGTVMLIIPSVVHTNMSYKPLRDLILKNKWLSEVCYTGGDVFNAPTVDTTILRCCKAGNSTITLKHAVCFDSPKTSIVESNYFSTFSNVISISDNNEGSLFAKLFNKRLKPVGDFFSVFQGIVTGNNPAYIFETEIEAIEKGIESELLHPLCHGRDIGKYVVKSRDRRIMYMNNSVDINKYPSAKHWLLPFKEKLEERREVKKGTIAWYSLQWPRVQSELDTKEKILLQRTRNEALPTRIVATIDDTGVYGMEGIYFVLPKEENAPSLRYLLGVINSSLINYLFKTKFLNLAIKADYLKQVRLPKESKEIVSLVDQALKAKHDDVEADTSAIEKRIDRLVFELYGLTNAEVKIVNPEEPISGAEDDLFMA